MTRLLIALTLVACSKEPTPPLRIVVKEPCTEPSSAPSAVTAEPTTPVAYEPAGSKRSIEDRAYALVQPFAEREGFTRRFVHCKPWSGGGQVCDLCFNHPKYYGQNRVWCDDKKCEAVVDTDDPRNADTDWNLCEKQ